MKTEVQELRKAIREARAGRKRGPFPPALRHRLKEHLRRRWQGGESLRDLAAELGLSDHTVQYWRSHWGARRESEQSLRVVEVIAEEPAGLTMQGPHGTRVENLTADEVVELWRRMA